MDNAFLRELINEARSRGGGLILNLEDKPAVVVLSIEKYNEILDGHSNVKPKMDKNMPTNKQKVLVTGGAGYIGGHLVNELLKAGYPVVVLDSLVTGRHENLHKDAIFIEGDLADEVLLKNLFSEHDIDAVFHMAASLEVEESVKEPEKYLENNLGNTMKLLKAMGDAGVKKIIFSSTASVYGQPEKNPIPETASLHPSNPYGASKLLAERAIKYFCETLGFNATVFRYFNACGFAPDAHVTPTHQSHLIYNVMLVAKGEKPVLQVFGNDYPTFDGTCVRDYIHVLDIVLPHILALEKMSQAGKFDIYNIGTGHGYSVAQIVTSASEVLNKIIPMEIAPRRAGDPPELVADNQKLQTELGYELKYSSLENIMKTSWEGMKSV